MTYISIYQTNLGRSSVSPQADCVERGRAHGRCPVACPSPASCLMPRCAPQGPRLLSCPVLLQTMRARIWSIAVMLGSPLQDLPGPPSMIAELRRGQPERAGTQGPSEAAANPPATMVTMVGVPRPPQGARRTYTFQNWGFYQDGQHTFPGPADCTQPL